MVICLGRGADLHMTQLMPLPLTVSCFSKIQIGFTFLVPAHLGSPGQRAIKWLCVCVCVCVCARVRACVHVCLFWQICLVADMSRLLSSEEYLSFRSNIPQKKV